jgi:uncharacterized protein (TIGR00645 family)
MARTSAKQLELFVERVVMGSRWLQAPLYIGLVVVLGVVVVKFPFKIWELMSKALIAQEADLVLAILSLVDLIMVANLVVMVIISGYENFVSHIETEGETDKLSWFGKLYALVVMHMAFVVSALILTYIDNLAATKKAAGSH